MLAGHTPEEERGSRRPRCRFFLSLVNGLFDLLFWPFRTLDPRYGLAASSLFTGAFLVLVFRYASNQQAIRQVKDRLQAHVLAVRLYQDQLGVVLRSYGRILRCTLTYLRHCLKPLAVMLVPMVLLLAQVELRLGRAALQPRDTFLLQARLDGRVSADQVVLRLPNGLALSASPVRIPEQKEISWRIRVETYGDFLVEVMAAGQSFTKQVTVAPDLARLSRRTSPEQLAPGAATSRGTPLACRWPVGNNSGEVPAAQH